MDNFEDKHSTKSSSLHTQKL